MRRPASADRENDRRQDGGLEVRYGKIGISAVAAALRYQSDAKNPAYAPCETDDAGRADEAA